MTSRDEELAATLTLLFASLDHKTISAALNKAVPPDLYWPTAREWMKLNGDQAAMLSAEDIVDYLDDYDYEPTIPVERLRAVANELVWGVEIDDGIYEMIGHHRDEIREELLKRHLIKEKTDGTTT